MYCKPYGYWLAEPRIEGAIDSITFNAITFRLAHVKNWQI